MKQVTLITTNRSKAEEIADALKPYGVLLNHESVQYAEDKEAHMEEVCMTAARELSASLRKNVMVDDTGIFFEACNNFPGALPKFVVRGIGLEGILRLLAGQPRGAYFETVIGYCEPGGEPRCFSAQMRGMITESIFEPIDHAMSYDSIFIPDGFEKPVCQMTLEEKTTISQRAQAVRKLGEFLKTA